jgi:hypothetical protein
MIQSIGLLVCLLVGLVADVWADGGEKSTASCPVCDAFRDKVTLEACESSVDATTRPFRTPEWEPQDLMASKDLIWQLENIAWYGDLGFRSKRGDPKELEAYIQQKIDFDQGHLWAATVDIDNDGIPEKVLKYVDGKCQYTTFWGTALFVLDDSGTRIDVAKTKPIREGYQFANYEVLFYQGYTLVVVWAPDELDKPTLLRLKDGRKERLQ